MEQEHQKTELILGNSNSRFSGVTSTMLQVLEVQKTLIKLAVLGKHHLPAETPTLTFTEAAKLCRKTLPDGRYRIFHARRNDEMLQALALKKILGAKIKIAFTSTAQRKHSWITRWLIREADGIITTSNAAAAYIDDGADIIIPHGIDLDTYSPPENRAQAWKELGLPGKLGIGIFGRVRHQKGVDILISSVLPLLKKHPDYTVVVCGQTTSDQESFLHQLQREIASAGLEKRFVFLGERPFSELPKLFQAMSIVTALSRNEGFGLTVLEAMASGAAVIASEAGAWKDIIDDGKNGYLVPCDSIEATRDRLSDLMANPEISIELGKAARAHVCEHYSIEREAREICQFLQSL